jgi:hypothetical protein
MNKQRKQSKKHRTKTEDNEVGTNRDINKMGTNKTEITQGNRIETGTKWEQTEINLTGEGNTTGGEQKQPHKSSRKEQTSGPPKLGRGKR